MSKLLVFLPLSFWLLSSSINAFYPNKDAGWISQSNQTWRKDKNNSAIIVDLVDPKTCDSVIDQGNYNIGNFKINFEVVFDCTNGKSVHYDQAQKPAIDPELVNILETNGYSSIYRINLKNGTHIQVPSDRNDDMEYIYRSYDDAWGKHIFYTIGGGGDLVETVVVDATSGKLMKFWGDVSFLLSPNKKYVASIEESHWPVTNHNGIVIYSNTENLEKVVMEIDRKSEGDVLNVTNYSASSNIYEKRFTPSEILDGNVFSGSTIDFQWLDDQTLSLKQLDLSYYED